MLFIIRECTSIYVTVPGKRAQVAHFFKIELLLPQGRVGFELQNALHKCSGVIVVSVHSYLPTAISSNSRKR